MRKTIVLLAALGLLSATPAFADIYYTPEPITGAYGDIGLYNPGDPGSINSVYVDPAYQSDIFEFDFAMHMSSIYYNASMITFSFMYDNSSLDVIGAHPVGGWTTYNYEGYEWPNSEAGGMVTVHDLTQGFITASDYEAFDTSAVVPFFHVTLHVNSAQYSQLNAFGILAMTLVSHTYSLTLWPEDFGYFGGVVHEVPEPATASLIFGGLAALAGGYIRRRR